MYSLLTVIIALAVYGYIEKPSWLSFVPWFQKPILTEEELAARKAACEKRFGEAKKLTEEVRLSGRRVTEPRLFFSSELGECVTTYLIQDPDLPDKETYNLFIIRSLDRGRDLYSKTKNMLRTYEDYLKKIDELDK